MEDWTIKIIDPGYKLSRDIYIFRPLPNGKVLFLGSKGEELEELGTAFKPTISLYPSQLQSLANELARQGISPIKEFTVGKLEATEKHLEDMRKIVFKE